MATPATAAFAVPSPVPASAAQRVRRVLHDELRLDVDLTTAAYLARRLEAEDEEILSFPASDADSGQWAFRVLPAARLRDMTVPAAGAVR